MTNTAKSLYYKAVKDLYDILEPMYFDDLDDVDHARYSVGATTCIVHIANMLTTCKVTKIDMPKHAQAPWFCDKEGRC